MASERALDMSSVDISQYRSDFPALAGEMNGKPLVFLDSSASAQKPRAVIEAMDDVLQHRYANVHRGLYSLSQELTADFEAVRRKVARFIGAPSEKNIVFTRNATESVNLVAQSWGRQFLQEGDEIILSAMEHHANIVPWQLLSNEIGIKIKVIPVTERGELDLEAFQSLLSERTKLISLVHISNALGTINNINEISKLARDFNPDIKLLWDGTQAVVHSSVDVSAIDADFYVFTGHKLYGPTGTGVLYAKEELLEAMPPFLGGGDMIETVSFDVTTFKEHPYKFEAGTPAIVEVIGLGAAIDYLEDIGMDAIAAHEADLLAYAMEKISDINGLKLYGTAPDKIGIISFTMEGAHPSDIAMVLDQMGIAIRTGHHCCMPLMEAMGVDATARMSLGLYNNRADIDRFVEGVHKVQEMFA